MGSELIDMIEGFRDGLIDLFLKISVSLALGLRPLFASHKTVDSSWDKTFSSIKPKIALK